jgi:hypothetical protein
MKLGNIVSLITASIYILTIANVYSYGLVFGISFFVYFGVQDYVKFSIEILTLLIIPIIPFVVFFTLSYFVLEYFLIFDSIKDFFSNIITLGIASAIFYLAYVFLCCFLLKNENCDFYNNLALGLLFFCTLGAYSLVYENKELSDTPRPEAGASSGQVDPADNCLLRSHLPFIGILKTFEMGESVPQTP